MVYSVKEGLRNRGQPLTLHYTKRRWGGTVTITELIHQVEDGEGPDSALELRLWGLMGGAGPSILTSLDRVVALIEQKLPGYRADVDVCSPFAADGMFGARVFKPSSASTKNYGHPFGGDAKTPARALLAAFLRAFREQAAETGQVPATAKDAPLIGSPVAFKQ